MPRIVLLACLLALALAGCAGTRIIVDLVPASDRLTETTVSLHHGTSEPGRGRRDGDSGSARAKIALIDVTGLLADARRPGLLARGENPVARFSEALEKAGRDAAVKAIIVRINSPGGTVTASDVMHREVARFRAETGKPVIALLADVAASGGYYLACAADRIIAHPTTITGSIGVIIQTLSVADGLSRIGIHAEAITSGPNKAMGSPLEPLAPSHRELLQGLVDEFYGNFLAVVKSSRAQVADSDLSWITDGRVVTGRKAHEAGLVDGVGDLHDAFAAARARAGVATARLVKYHRPMETVGSAYASAAGTGERPGSASAMQVNLLQLNVDGLPLLEQPGFYYLWDPAAWR
jgi:protease-4